MMKKLLQLLGLFCLLSGCSSKEDSAQNQFIFYSSPSFFGWFKVELDNKERKVIFLLPNKYGVADTISADLSRRMDSTDLASIEKFLPKEIKFEVKPKEVQFETLKKCFQQLSRMKEDKSRYLDGIGICLETKSSEKIISKKIFMCPRQSSMQGQLIMKIYDIKESIFNGNTPVENAIENSQRYFKDPVLKVKSTNPLYVKFLDDNPRKLKEAIARLPPAKTIFADLTNFHEDKNEFLEKAIRERYDKVKWILKSDENYGF